jgi:hypothetical protein
MEALQKRHKLLPTRPQPHIFSRVVIALWKANQRKKACLGIAEANQTILYQSTTVYELLVCELLVNSMHGFAPSAIDHRNHFFFFFVAQIHFCFNCKSSLISTYELFPWLRNPYWKQSLKFWIDFYIVWI